MNGDSSWTQEFAVFLKVKLVSRVNVMSRNLSGLNGRNVMFWKWCVPVNAYIIKYTEEGNYYALSRRSGTLYEFSQYTGEDTDGTKGEVVRIKRVPYSVLDKYNIKI